MSLNTNYQIKLREKREEGKYQKIINKIDTNLKIVSKRERRVEIEYQGSFY